MKKIFSHHLKQQFGFIGLLIFLSVSIVSARSPYDDLKDGIFKNDEPKVLAALANGADLNAAYTDQKTNEKMPLLMASIYFDSPHLIELLLKKGAAEKAAIKTYRSLTAFQLAIYLEKFDIAEIFLRNGSKVDEVSGVGDSALWRAADENKPETIKWLIAHGADVNFRNAVDETPLIIATLHGSTHLAVVQELIAHRADVNAVSLQDLTPLMIARQLEKNDMNTADAHKITVALTAAGAINTPSSAVIASRTPQKAALAAVLQVNGAGLDKLLAAGVSVDTADSNGNPLLMHALRLGQSFTDSYKVADYLIEKGANVNAVNKLGDDALMRAIKDDNKRAAAILLKSGKVKGHTRDSTDLHNKEDQTALGLIIFKEALQRQDNKFDPKVDGEWSQILNWFTLSSPPTLEMVLKSGANPFMTKYGEWMAAIIDEGGRITPEYNSTGDSILLTAVEIGNPVYVEKLIQAGLPPDMGNRQYGQTPLMIAARESNIEIIKVLLKNGANINAVNKYKGNALSYAKAYDSKGIETIILLIENGIETKKFHKTADKNSLTDKILTDAEAGMKGAELRAKYLKS